MNADYFDDVIMVVTVPDEPIVNGWYSIYIYESTKAFEYSSICMFVG